MIYILIGIYFVLFIGACISDDEDFLVNYAGRIYSYFFETRIRVGRFYDLDGSLRYVTSDRKVFETLVEAENHEKYLIDVLLGLRKPVKSSNVLKASPIVYLPYN